MPLDIPEPTREHIRDETSGHGIAVAALSATYNMAHPDPAVRDDGLARLAVMAAAADPSRRRHHPLHRHPRPRRQVAPPP
jgi:sugar phosphate isomerase/epimerase